jgi:PAS domain S-box-containing protein
MPANASLLPTPEDDILKNARQSIEAAETMPPGERHYQNLVEHSPNPLAVQQDGIIIFVNPAAVQMVGAASARDLLGKPMLELVHPEFHQIVSEQVKRIAAGGFSQPRVERKLFKVDGTVIDVELQGTSIVYEDKPAILIAMRDITWQKETEAALRESEEKFSKVFRDAPVWIAITDMEDATYQDVNAQALRDSGYSRDEVLGHTAVEIGWIKPDDRARLVQEIQKNGRITDLEMEFRSKDGRSMSGLVNGEQIVIGGRPCLLTVTIDISERKWVEEKFSAAFQISPDSMNINRLKDGMNLEINQGFTTLTGYTPEEIIGKTTFELDLWVNPQDRDRLGKGLREHGEVNNLETQFRAKNGQILYCTISARIIEINQEKCVLTVTRDITAQRAAQLKLAEQSKRDQIINELSLRMAESAYDFDKIASFCVKRCAEIIGDGASIFWYTPDRPNLELVAVYNPNPELVTYFRNYFRQHPVGAHEGSYGRVIQSNQAVLNAVVDMERVKAVATADRREYYQKLPVYSSIFAPLRSEGHCIGVIGLGRHDASHTPYTEADLAFLQDIADRISFGLINAHLYQELQKELSERIRAENEVRRLNNELEQRVQQRTAELQAVNKELEAFSYSVSHDLRAPLRALDGFSGALLTDNLDQLDEQGQHYLARIQEASRRMRQLIEDLLNLSRINRYEMTLSQVDLSAMAWRIVHEMQVDAPGRSIQYDILPDIVAWADPNLIKIALDNLLRNAFKFTGKREVATIQVGTCEENGERVYFVRDNGVGFDMAYADKLFTPFQRLHGMHEYPGSGIGLSIVQRIITRHGGRIWPESAENQGATFYFTLENTP